MALLEEVRSNFPWLQVIGLEDFVLEQVRDGAPISELLAEVRQTEQYKARFPGMVKADGTRRFATEAEYLREEERYREVLQKYGAFDPNNDTAFGYMAFMDQGITPQQLDQRFKIYRGLERGSAELRDAFYVYGGLDVSVDDLFQATVSPQFREELIDTYDKQVAKQNLDYETFITRATERGLERVSETLRNMQQLGLVTGSAVSQIASIDPNFAREMMGSLFQGGQSDTATLSLDELMASFDYAMIGSAASKSGFELPTPERIEEFKAAGVDRAQALRGYSQAALREAGLDSMASRFNADDLSRRDLEGAFITGEASNVREVQELFEKESALGRTGGGFSREATSGGRVAQRGRRRY